MSASHPHSASPSASLALTEQTLIPDLLAAAPQLRPVLDRYGLRGCGGALGPHETLEFFAKAHDVPLPSLMRELRVALLGEGLPPAGSAPQSGLADAIYRPFFRAGIAVILTLGAVWGAYLLLRIGLLGSFTSVGLHEVNAHGHAQIFGWVGLFVMGFAYQAFPRFKHTSLRHPRLAWATLWMMLAGLLARSLGEPFAPALPWAGAAALAGGGVEIAAIGLFIFIIVKTLLLAEKPLAVHDGFILCALGWFAVQAVWETALLAAYLAAPTREALLGLVATWQAPLREVQIHGFALLMILGVSQRLLHPIYGLRAPSARLSAAALPLLNLAIAGEVLGLILMRAHGHAWAGLWYGSTLLLAGTVTALVVNWRIWGRAEESDRSLKFLRAAYTWLLISLAMLVLLPAYQFGLLPWLAPESASAKMGFSHAYHGAIRHAITVGFISLMIVGVAARVVPTLMGVDARRLPSLWLPFILINTGCAMRVGFQTLTDFHAGAFPLAGMSGLLEVAGLAVWGVHLWRVMAGRFAAAGAGCASRSGARAPVLPGQPIAAGHIVGDVLDAHPDLLETFVGFGFAPLRNPIFRSTLARTTTIERACRALSVDQAALLASVNAVHLCQDAPAH